MMIENIFKGSYNYIQRRFIFDLKFSYSMSSDTIESAPITLLFRKTNLCITFVKRVKRTDLIIREIEDERVISFICSETRVPGIL